jgi:hypothetical protein
LPRFRADLSFDKDDLFDDPDFKEVLKLKKQNAKKKQE